MPHIPKPPSIDHGIVAFIWALFLGLLWWGFLAATHPFGIGDASAFILAVLTALAIFFYVRIYGEDEPRTRQATRSSERS
jgi:hypothetical protein